MSIELRRPGSLRIQVSWRLGVAAGARFIASTSPVQQLARSRAPCARCRRPAGVGAAHLRGRAGGDHRVDARLDACVERFAVHQQGRSGASDGGSRRSRAGSRPRAAAAPARVEQLERADQPAASVGAIAAATPGARWRARACIACGPRRPARVQRSRTPAPAAGAGRGRRAPPAGTGRCRRPRSGGALGDQPVDLGVRELGVPPAVNVSVTGTNPTSRCSSSARSRRRRRPSASRGRRRPAARRPTRRPAARPRSRRRRASASATSSCPRLWVRRARSLGSRGIWCLECPFASPAGCPSRPIRARPRVRRRARRSAVSTARRRILPSSSPRRAPARPGGDGRGRRGGADARRAHRLRRGRHRRRGPRDRGRHGHLRVGGRRGRHRDGFHAETQELEGAVAVLGMPELEGAGGTILLPDRSPSPDGLLAELTSHAPGVPILGGVASAGAEEGGTVLFHGDEVDEARRGRPATRRRRAAAARLAGRARRSVPS